MEKVVREAYTPEDAAALGFVGRVKSYPPELHYTGNEQLRADVYGANTEIPTAIGGADLATLEGAVVNSNDSPTPSGGVSGPGASTEDDED